MLVPSFDLCGNVVDTAVTVCVDDFCDLVRAEYSNKWGCEESSVFADSRAQLEANSGLGLTFDICSLQKAFAGLKKHAKMDAYGVSLEIMWLFLFGSQKLQLSSSTHLHAWILG